MSLPVAVRVNELTEDFDPATAHCERLFRDLDLAGLQKTPTPPRSAAVDWALSGAMWLTGSSNGPPQFADGALASAAHGAALALGALAPDSGLDKLDGPALFGERAALAGLSRQGCISAGGSARLLPTRGGIIALNLPRDDDWRLLPALLETDSIDPIVLGDWTFVAEHVAHMDRSSLVQRGRLLGLAIAPADRKTPNSCPYFKFQHESEVAPTRWREKKIRLLDLTSLWAGPLATSLLAIAGIEVLKIESPERPDGARYGPKPFFDLLNGNKHGCTLNLHSERDRDFFEQLLTSADIVLESSRPRGLGQLGFDAGSWVQGRAGRIWASITGYGRDSDAIAFGDDAAIAAGLGWPLDTSRKEARFCGDAIADPLTGLHAAFCILAALTRGRGGLLDVSLLNVTAHAANIQHDGLALPTDVDSTGDTNQWCVLEKNRRISIQQPRSRDLTWTAPPLAPMTEDRLADWNGPC